MAGSATIIARAPPGTTTTTICSDILSEADPGAVKVK
jgi:hypothetical protein